MEFRLLGQVEVWARDGPLRLGGVKPRTLLAVLALDANRVVGTERLVDTIWESGPPATAGTQIHGYVSALRKRFAEVDDNRAVIVTEPTGYRLVTRPGELDLEVFEAWAAEAGRALADARATDAAAGFGDAIALWRGPALGGVAETLGAARERLAERRLAAVEGRIEAELRLGRHDEVIPELRDVVAENPFREGPRGQLMLALYRAGRSAEALAAYREGRETLAEELGIDPGSELQRLEKAILTADSALDPPSVSAVEVTVVSRPAQLPPDVVDFTGRQEQVRQVCEALGTTGDPPTAVPIAAIAGRGGVGKTSLAVHAAHRMRGEFPDGQLHVNLHGAQARPADPSEVLGRFLRALGIEPARVPETVEERSELYRSRLSDRRMLVVLDNAADEAQVRPLLPGEPGCAVLVTSRSRLAGLEGVQLVELDILDPGAALELLGRVAGVERVAGERRAGEEIVRLCGYLPLAVRIAGAKLTARPHWSPERLVDRLADERHRLDELTIGDLEVRANVALSYAGMSPPEQRAFRRLGLLEAPDFAAWTLSALSGVSREEAEELADGLVHARLLDVTPGAGGAEVRYRFHDLLRLYARELAFAEEPPPERHAALQRAIEGWLHAAEDAGARIPSASFGDIVEPAQGWRAEPPIEGLERDPLEWFEREWIALTAAVQQAHDLGWNDLVLHFVARFGPYVVVRGRYDDWRSLAELARSAAQRAGDRRSEALALRRLGELALLQYRLVEARTLLERSGDVLRQVGDRHGEALAASGLGAVEAEAGDAESARSRLEDAVRVLSEVGDHRSAAWTLLRLGTLYRLQERHDEAAEHLLQALATLDGRGTSVDEAAVVERLGTVRTRQGRTAEACEHFDRALRLRREHRDRFGEANALRGLGEARWAEGHHEPALDCLNRALRLWREIGFSMEEARTWSLIGDVHADRGDRARAASARAEAGQLSGQMSGQLQARTEDSGSTADS